MPTRTALITPAAAALAAAALAVSALATTGPASAAAPRCHGQRATVVGHGATVTGTSHRDVIVSNGARTVTARGGDDLICLTPGSPAVTVAAGPGDDTVDGRRLHPRVTVTYRSGTGSDRYLGGSEYDGVTLTPDGRDRIRTGGGEDHVTVPQADRTGAARIDLGAGDDVLSLAVGRLGGRLVGGPGRDGLAIDQTSTRDWSIDNREGRARAGDQTRFRWSGFESFDLDFLQAPRIAFLGSDVDESLFLPDFPPTGQDRTLALATGGGDDTVEVGAGDHGDLDLGSGTDRATFDAISSGRSLTADLTAGTAVVSGGDDGGARSQWFLAGVEDLRASDFARAALIGDDGPNTLDADTSFDSSADGRGGIDTCRARVTANCESS